MLRKLIIATNLLLLPALSSADEALADNLLQPQFTFKHQTMTLRDESTVNPVLSQKDAVTTAHMNQFDATFTYPFTRRDDFNFDMGVNIRFIDASFDRQALAGQGNYHLYTALPMFYANALINLPFEGLQASVGASHMEFEQYYALDYSARLSYNWSNGFGLSGGWQHQQFSIDNNDIQAQFENKGPFLDFNYRF